MEKQEESVEKEEGMDKQGAVKNQDEVMKNQEELGEEQEEAVEKEEEEAEGGEEQGEVGEKQEEAENKQEDAVAAEDPPECEKEAAKVMEGEQGDNGVASGEVPDGRDQEMDTNTSPASVDAAVSQSPPHTHGPLNSVGHFGQSPSNTYVAHRHAHCVVLYHG